MVLCWTGNSFLGYTPPQDEGIVDRLWGTAVDDMWLRSRHKDIRFDPCDP